MIFRDALTDYTGHNAVDQDGRVVMYHVSWWVPRVLPNRLWEAELDKRIRDNTQVSLGWHEFNYYSYGSFIANGGTTFNSWMLPSEVHKPVRIFIFFQNQNAITDQHINAMVFPAQPIQNIYVKINGVPYPMAAYECDFTATGATTNTRGWARVYNEFLRAGNKDHTTYSGPSISYEEFARLYQIFVFDLEAQDDMKVWTSQSTATIELRATLNANVVGNIGIYAVIESQRYMTMAGVGGKTNVLQG
jgi:hypothetical protein